LIRKPFKVSFDPSSAGGKSVPPVAESRSHRGRLTIFLGAAHGVGKTSAMLQTALARQRDGTRVVVATVNSHGQPELAKFADELSSLAPRIVEREKRLYEELDVDAIIEAAPGLVVVDELAHPNAPGGNRPAKRYQDVLELLSAGVDVYTTLNVEEIESLTDLIEEVTGYRVLDTVPDEVVDTADDLAVIDCTPENLVRRWREGKVHLPPRALGIADRYFSPASLAALRDLALRRTAQRVDDQMLTLMREYTASAPHPTSERILVCIDEASTSQNLLHYTSRLALRLQVRWTALYVESHEYARLTEGERDRIAERLRLAERLGGNAMMIPGGSVAEEILAYARDNDVKTIVLGRTRRAWWSRLARRPLARWLVQHAGDIAIHVIPSDDVRAEPSALAPRFSQLRPTVVSLVVTLSVLAAMTALLFQTTAYATRTSVALAYLTFVLAVAVGYGFLPSIAASIGGVLAYDYFFVPPLYTLNVNAQEDVITLLVFLVVALTTSTITARTRSQARIASNRARVTAELYAFNRWLAETTDIDVLLELAARRISEMLHASVALLIPEDDGLVARLLHPADVVLDDAAMRRAEMQLHNTRPLEETCQSFEGPEWLFLPLRTARRVVGVIGIVRPRHQPLPSPDDRRLLVALANQTSMAAERIILAAENNETRLLRETEILRSSLLNSVAHDFRTPLATVLGTLTALRSRDTTYDRETSDELLAAAQEEAERLNRFVSNLLDMTRLESGAIGVHRELVDASEIVASAVRRARSLLAKHKLVTAIDRDIPMLRLDYVLLDQVLFNLLDNAAKYSEPGTTIGVTARRRGQSVVIEIADEGVGIPDEDLAHIFEKSYRARSSASGRPGTGLGLTICRGFLEAQGGTIVAGNRADRHGAVFRISFPIEHDSVKATI
jgi:two-component system sensor histidine kinase KdpD